MMNTKAAVRRVSRRSKWGASRGAEERMHSALMYMLSAIGRGNDQPDKPVEHSRFSDQALFEPNVGLLLEVPIIDEPKPTHWPHNLMRHEQAGFETTTDAST
ncbi:hypothetical protein AGR9A_Lc50114 [Agrobacterium salinitolerans str. Hayward 0363]|nr:hypothetical protein AGR9A_Lc50114 [Agrobacterium salinitolerans str. Hayward 0363]